MQIRGQRHDVKEHEAADRQLRLNSRPAESTLGCEVQSRLSVSSVADFEKTGRVKEAFKEEQRLHLYGEDHLMIMLLKTSTIHRRSSDKLQFVANGVVFERVQFVIPNKGDWCSAVRAHCPIAS